MSKLLKNILALLITAGLGFILKYSNGEYQDFLNNSLAGAAYVVFWIILAAIILPEMSPLKLSIWVTGITCLLEFLQLAKTPFLEYFRQFWLGKTILGTTFTWKDIPWYFLGGFIGYFIIRLTKKKRATRRIALIILNNI